MPKRKRRQSDVGKKPIKQPRLGGELSEESELKVLPNGETYDSPDEQEMTSQNDSAIILNDEKISNFAEELLQAAYREEQAFRQQWSQFNPQRTPPRQKNRFVTESPQHALASPDTLSLLCHETDAVSASQKHSPTSKSSGIEITTIKDFETELRNAMEKNVFITFKKILRQIQAQARKQCKNS